MHMEEAHESIDSDRHREEAHEPIHVIQNGHTVGNATSEEGNKAIVNKDKSENATSEEVNKAIENSFISHS